MKQEIYSCSICGQIVELLHRGGGKLVCCNKPMQMSVEKKEAAVSPNAPYWSCSNCHYIVQATAPPEVCPSCGASCQFVDVTCYIPECGFAGIDSRLMK